MCVHVHVLTLSVCDKGEESSWLNTVRTALHNSSGAYDSVLLKFLFESQEWKEDPSRTKLLIVHVACASCMISDWGSCQHLCLCQGVIFCLQSLQGECHGVSLMETNTCNGFVGCYPPRYYFFDRLMARKKNAVCTNESKPFFNTCVYIEWIFGFLKL